MTEWSPNRSVVITVITKLDDAKSYYQFIIKTTISEKRRIAIYERKGKFAIKILTKADMSRIERL